MKVWIKKDLKRVYLNDKNFDKNYVKVYFDLLSDEKMRLNFKIVGFPDARLDLQNLENIRAYLINKHDLNYFNEILKSLREAKTEL